MSANSPITAATEAPTIPPVLMDGPRCGGELLDEVALFELDVVLVEEVEYRLVLLVDNCVALGFVAGGPEEGG
jgi:hypothetical protein